MFGQPSDWYIRCQQRHNHRSDGDPADVLPANEDDELRHTLLGKWSDDNGEPGTDQEAEYASYEALFEDDAVVEIAVGETFRLQDVVFARLFDCRRVRS
jgi:hypothetical protein